MIAGLFVLGREPGSRTSKALWVPVIALLITASRPLSAWIRVFGGGPAIQGPLTPEQFLDGSPTDRALYAALIGAAIVILGTRSQQVCGLLRRNLPVLLFFAYCGISVLWSDYSFVAFKRWIKGIGDLLCVLVILTEARPQQAIAKLLSRTTFVLIPLSLLFVKYYPELGRTYNSWTFSPMHTGVALTKNGLGMLCMICGIASVWQLVTVYKDRAAINRASRLLAHAIVMPMIFWLLLTADSMTSFCCLIVGGVLVVLTSARSASRHHLALQLVIVLALALSSVAIFTDSAGWLITAMDRDPTLTGRTNIWQVLISLAGNSWLGTGFESFWTGARLQTIWAGTMDGLNEAHNGYLEVYLNLGWVGVIALGYLISTGYHNVISRLRRPQAVDSVKAAFFVAALIYSLTEAGFRETAPVWVCFLLSVASVQARPLPLPHRGETL